MRGALGEEKGGVRDLQMWGLGLMLKDDRRIGQ